MNILLDTHIALWAISDSPKLSDKARAMITDPDNTVYYSSVSTWEVLLKCASFRNNLSLTASDFISYCDESGYIPLPLKNEHVAGAAQLNTEQADKIHNDPFDRMLLSQAKSENFSFLTHDEKLSLYNEKCVVMV
ncbi:MAG: type II toxin-antitoxin system VapC family toxin [Lachnospiraceae bacterium]|nr:type II toxin-antitoxin system VapC family toxin [Lachnospiraceae bacterium]